MYKVSNVLQTDLGDNYNTLPQVSERISFELEPYGEIKWVDWSGNSHPIRSTAHVLEVLEFNKEITLTLCRPGKTSLLLYIKKDGIY